MKPKWFLNRKVEFFPFDIWIAGQAYVHGKNDAFPWRFKNIFFYYKNGYELSFRSMKNMADLKIVLQKEFSKKFVKKVGGAIKETSNALVRETYRAFKNKSAFNEHLDEFITAYENMLAIFQVPDHAQYLLPNADKKLLYEFGMMRDYAARNLAIAENYYRPRLGKTLKLPKKVALTLLPNEIKTWLNTGTLPKDIIKRKTNVIAVSTRETSILWNKKADAFFKKEYLQSRVLPRSKNLSGKIAYSGVVTGKVYIAFNDMDFRKIPKNAILICSMTRYTALPYIKKAAAIVTDQGGITCHAAILAREFKIPTITGTLHSTDIFKTGDLVEVDANQGIVRRL